MTNVDFRALYATVLRLFDFNDRTVELMHHIMGGSDKAEHYEEALKHDRLYTEAVCRKASERMKGSVVSSLAHGVALMGQEHVRDLFWGHEIARRTRENADNTFRSIEETGQLVNYARRADEQARKAKNEYRGISFAAGFIFDVFAAHLATSPELSNDFTPLLEHTWKHSLRTATLAWQLASHERILISHRKIVFASALLHDVGKLALAVYDPKAYKQVLKEFEAGRSNHPDSDAFEEEIEHKYFDLSHCEIGSAVVSQTRFLSELETEVDFHHDITLLRVRNPDAFLGGAVVNIADHLATLSVQNSKFTADEVRPWLSPHSAYFPLSAQEVLETYAKSVRLL
jgi:putative nucleotidyltransferase with HDIG domain